MRKVIFFIQFLMICNTIIFAQPYLANVSQPPCGAASLTFTFSEAVLCNTVENCDFTLIGPGGPYTLSGVAGINCNAGDTAENTFTINVSPSLTTSGSFNLNLVAGCGYVTGVSGGVAVTGTYPFTINSISISLLVS
ncbi:MAG: hypothetical protein HY738_00480 [Bacteroidia bacterium]|nr:hypothetical protein [Bacteroidia bacterium]